jgi:serine/threonine-protein phosphatase 2A regulatory subunit A
MEIIEECDNDDEFLIKLGEQLVSLKDKVGGKDFVHFLLPPLETLLCMEESLVRDKTVECIKQLAEDQNTSFIIRL